MAYSDFSLARVKKDFGLTLDESRNLFVDTKPVSPSEILTTILIDYVPLATFISTEKARSEFLIAPILAEVRRLLNKQVSLFSGKDFTVDPERGLQGFCDYIAVAKAVRTLDVRHLQWHLANNQTAPVFCEFDFLTLTNIAQCKLRSGE